MKPKIKNLIKKTRKNKLLRILLGILLIFLGVIGGFIPILQGWMLILLGVLILFGPEIIKFEKHKK
jgi:uncharacterized protein YqgC (DUF456 family)